MRKIQSIFIPIIIVLVCLSGCHNDKGFSVDFYENGDTLSYTSLKNGLKNGECRLYFKGNKLKQKLNYRNDSLMGINQKFYLNGQLNEYTYFENGMPVYYKKFNKEGDLIDQSFGVISPNKMYNDIQNPVDSVLISYSFVHTMYKNSFMALCIINKNMGDTVLWANSDTTFFRYYLKDFNPGVNSFEIYVYEFIYDDDLVKGLYVEQINIDYPSSLEVCCE